MCLEGNSASLSIRYLNAQLGSLWENAHQCAHDSGVDPNDVKSQDYDKSKYTRALAQYHFFGRKAPKTVRTTDDLLFYAQFGRPELKFICNHEAVFFLTVTEGHVNLDYNKSTIPGIKVNHAKNKVVNGARAAFRIEFSRSNLKGRDSRIGNSTTKHIIQMLILNMESAKLVTLKGGDNKSLAPDTKDALDFYLHKYLEFLVHAGNHVLFDLPDFDDDKYQAKIDYATYQDTSIDLMTLCDGITVHDIDIKDINDSLYFRWQNAARKAERPNDFLTLCLAELSSAWLMNSSIDRHFFIRFGVPKIRALCSCEVILTFDIRNIAFFETSDLEHERPDAIYADWTISFIVGVSREEGSKHITLDLNTARYVSRFSSHKNVDTLVSTYFKDIIHFMTVDYIDILIQYSMHIIQLGAGLFVEGGYSEYESDRHYTSWSDASDHEQDVYVRSGGEVIVWTERVEKMDLFGFDQVLALSQTSISSHFFNLYKHASTATSGSLRHWSLDQFSTHFNPISVHFLSNGKAVVLISISSGEMSIPKETEKTTFWQWMEFLRPQHSEATERIEFGDLTVAFEVDLEFRQHKELEVHDSWHHSFEGTFICQHRRLEEHVFQHLLLNFHNAKYIDSLSNVATLGKGRDSPTKLDTLLYYMKDYLHDLAHRGLNIIHSIPIFTNQNETTFGYTSVAHKIVSKTNVTIDNCRYVVATDAPVLLILGMCNFRPMPPLLVEWFAGWVIESKQRRSFGTLCLSRAAFLEGRLLPLLSNINALTTIVPKFAGILDGEWRFELTNWKEDPYRKHRPCTWKERRNVSAHHLEYVWQHRDEWNYEHEGTSNEEKKCEYTLACHTKNRLHIPTIFRPNSLEIQLSGESYLKVSGRTDVSSWSKRTSAKWSASIVVYSRASGLSVEVSGQTRPVFADEDAEGHCSIDVSALHAKHLPRTVSLGGVLESLKHTLEGGWEFAAPGGESYGLTNPIFTRRGDLVVQLCEHKPPAIRSVLTPAVSYSDAVKVHANLGTHTHHGATLSSTEVHAQAVHNGHISVTLPDPLLLDRDFNASSTTIESPALKTPSTSSLDVAAPIFSPKAAKPKSNGKTVKVDVAKVETIPSPAVPILDAGLDAK